MNPAFSFALVFFIVPHLPIEKGLNDKKNNL